MSKNVQSHAVESLSSLGTESADAKLKTIYELSPFPIIVTDNQGNILDANPAAGKLFGLDHSLLAGKDLINLSAEESTQDFVKVFKAILREEHVHMESHVRSNSLAIPVEVHANVIDYDGHPAVLFHLRDMTRRYEAEEMAMKREAYLTALSQASRALVESRGALDYSSFLQPLGEVTGASRVHIFTRHDGPDGEAMVSQTAEWCAPGIQPQSSNPEMQDIGIEAQGFSPWLQVLEHGEAIHSIVDRLPETPRAFLERHDVIAVLGLPIFVNGHLEGMIGFDNCVNTDLWESVEVELLRTAAAALGQALERIKGEFERTRLAMAIQQAAEAIVITDTKGQVIYVNPAFSKNTGYTESEIIGENLSLLQSGHHDRGFYSEIWKTLFRGEVWHGQFINRKKDGSIFEEDSTISPIRDASGKIVNFVEVAHDVTREKQLESQVRQAQKLDSIGKLAGGIAHDFNNMLTPIIGYGHIALDKLTIDHLARPDIEQIVKSAERAARLTKQLLAFGRKQSVEMKPLELNAVIVDMEHLLIRTIGEHIELVHNLDDDLGMIDADTGMLEQVILNLGVNARDAMPRGGPITLSTHNVVLDDEFCVRHTDTQPGDYVMMAFRDSGTGIPADVADQIFEPFFTTKEKGKGTGLGLSTVYGIIKQCHGVVEFETEVGKGTEFRLYFPRTFAVAEEITEETDEPMPRGTETVLVVEDEVAVRELTVRILRTLGYEALEASNAGEALLIAEQLDGKLDLVISDMVMPRLSGPMLIARLRQVRDDFKFLYMSGLAGDTLSDLPFHDAQHRFLQKPFTRRGLALKVRKILEEA